MLRFATRSMPGVSGHEVRGPDAAHACPTSDVCCRDGCQINQNTAQHYRPSFVHAPFATTSQPRSKARVWLACFGFWDRASSRFKL